MVIALFAAADRMGTDTNSRQLPRKATKPTISNTIPVRFIVISSLLDLFSLSTLFPCSDSIDLDVFRFGRPGLDVGQFTDRGHQ
jgi:hypothetical protein